MLSSRRFLAENATAARLHAQLCSDRFIHLIDDPDDLARLRQDVHRIAADMDDPDRPPPMFWTGIPFPTRVSPPSHGYCLVISVGGTKTTFALMRLDRGELKIVDRRGVDVAGADVARVKRDFTMPTPGPEQAASGREMVQQMVAAIAAAFAACRSALERTEHVLLSWGYAHEVVRCAPTVLGGVTARVTQMQKDQEVFDADLRGCDIGQLFSSALLEQTGLDRPLTVANDAVMALHYFLVPEAVKRFHQIGLLINGTGTNFAIAEPYVEPAGVDFVPREPKRTGFADPVPRGMRRERYFVNYETGSIELQATASALDADSRYPLEENALAGGRAFGHGFREILRRHVGEDFAAALEAATATGGALKGPEVSLIACGGPEALSGVFPRWNLDEEAASMVCLAARAVLERSALHAAMVLAAVTHRLQFGLGSDDRADLLAVEGSVWSTHGYWPLVRDFWARLVAPAQLRVEEAHEPSFDASLPGPVYLAANHSTDGRH